MTTLIHTSPTEITEITNTELFGECLFFSDDAYFMTKAENPVTYELEVNDKDIIHVSSFFFDDNYKVLDGLVARVKVLCECDTDDANDLLDASKSAYDFIDDCEDASEADLIIQGMQGEAAKLLGYIACESEDEQGTVYIVSMKDQLSNLKKA